MGKRTWRPDVEIGRRYADMLERLETKQNRFVDRQEGCGEIVIDLRYHSDLPEIEIKEN